MCCSKETKVTQRAPNEALPRCHGIKRSSSDASVCSSQVEDQRCDRPDEQEKKGQASGPGACCPARPASPSQRTRETKRGPGTRKEDRPCKLGSGGCSGHCGTTCRGGG